MKTVAKGIWLGFWTAAEMFLQWIAIGFITMSEVCGAIARKFEDPK